MNGKSLRIATTQLPIRDIAAYWNKFKPLTDVDEAEKDVKWIQQAALLDDLSARNNTIICIWSTITPDRFAYVTDKSKLLGYDASMYTGENGVAASFNNVHPRFRNAAYLANEKLVRDVVDKQIKPAHKSIFSMDYLYQKQNGDYIHVLQQICLLEVDNTGYPLLSMSFISDISHLKKPDTCNLCIIFLNGVEFFRYNFDLKCFENLKPFSRQEKNILQLLGSGLTTNEIGNQLNISPNTVDTHRRNLIKKTDCIDTTAVVTYARMTGLI